MPAFILPEKHIHERQRILAFLKEHHAVEGYRVRMNDVCKEGRYTPHIRTACYKEAFAVLVGEGLLRKEKDGYSLTRQGENLLWGSED